jgi:hypothetical protein
MKKKSSSVKVKKGQSKKIKVKSKKQYGGDGEIVDFNSFWNNLGVSNQLKINNGLKGKSELNLENIKDSYKISENIGNNLYDFMFKNDESSRLFKIWDHGIGKPESITAGLSGIHIYVTVDKNKNLKIIGKFIR